VNILHPFSGYAGPITNHQLPIHLREITDFCRRRQDLKIRDCHRLLWLSQNLSIFPILTKNQSKVQVVGNKNGFFENNFYSL